MIIIMLFMYGCLGFAIWFAVCAALYAAFTASYLVAAWGWQMWRKGRTLWKRT